METILIEQHLVCPSSYLSVLRQIITGEALKNFKTTKRNREGADFANYDHYCSLPAYNSDKYRYSMHTFYIKAVHISAQIRTRSCVWT